MSSHYHADTFPTSKGKQIFKKAAILSVTLVILYCSYAMLFRSMLVVAGLSGGSAAALSGSSLFGGISAESTKVPQYFDPNPELWPGPTATGRAPFMAQETMAPMGEKNNETIRRLFGHLSPYAPNQNGFGVKEYPLPPGANITQVHVRHWTRIL
jgi:hypothetical protein